MNRIKTEFKHIKDAGAELAWYCGCLMAAMFFEIFDV